jgi:uncharacterized protein (TIGR00251 family)
MLRRHPSGTLVDVWVVPGASRDEIVGEHGDALKVRVSAPPEGGKANKAVARLLAELLPGHRAVVVSGATTRRKQVLVEGVAPAEVSEALPG